MQFDDFKLERAVLEVRYPKTFMLWDTAGRLWGTLQEKWPLVEDIEAQPARTVFRLSLKHIYDLIVEMDSSRVVCFCKGDSLKEFTAVTDQFLVKVLSFLDIVQFIRVGFRLTYFMETKSRQDADNLVIASGMVRVPKEPTFGINKPLVVPDIVVRFEGQDATVRASVSVQTKKIHVNPPAEFSQWFEPIHKEIHGICYDVDHMINGQILVSQVNIRELVAQVFHQIKRDSSIFLRGVK